MLAPRSILTCCQKYPVSAYCLLTFSVTWGLEYFYTLVKAGNDLPSYNFSLLAQYGPSLSAVFLIAFTEGREGLRRTVKSMLHWCVGPWWMLLAFVFEPVLFLTFTLFYWVRYNQLPVASGFTLASSMASL
jgi:hypothetical protein